MFRFALCLVLVTCASISVAVAQRVVGPGDTVRVHLLSEVARFDGVVLGVDGSQVRVRGVADERTIERASVLGLRVLDGRRPATGRGAMIGLGLGAALGIVVGVVGAADDDSLIDFGPEIIPLAAAFMGGGGAIIGGLVGSFMTRDRWVPATMPVAPTGEGAGILSRLVPVIRPGAESSLLVGVRVSRSER